jgi:hypothetical protein
MVDVVLEKFDGSDALIFTMTFTVFDTWGGNATFPVVANPIPQEGSEDRILIKIMGNSTDTKYSWNMKDEDTTIVTGVGDPVVKTVPEQIAFWLSNMRPISISDKFVLTFNFTDPLVFNGVVSNFKWDMSSNAPVTAKCSFQFMEGNVIVDDNYEKDTPSPPLNVVLSSPSAGELKNDWVKEENPGSSDVGAYLFLYRIVGVEKWEVITIDDLLRTHTKTGLATGNYESVMIAKNLQGAGLSSKIKTQAVA